MSRPVTRHYQQALQTDTIIQRLQDAYPGGPSLFQLAPVDQLHIGGIRASQRLLTRLAALNPNKVLDIGSGPGGLMRLAASEPTLDIEMVGIDITHPLNCLNRQLFALYNPELKPQLITGDAHRLPLLDASFDVVLFQHSLLNMPDPAQALAEARRVLKPGGAVLMHEVLQGSSHNQMRYPVPWASDAAHSHLHSETTLTALLQQQGFGAISIDDWSQEALAWRKRQSEKERNGRSEPAPVSPALILGDQFAAMGKNLMLNLEQEAARVVEVVGVVE